MRAKAPRPKVQRGAADVADLGMLDPAAALQQFVADFLSAAPQLDIVLDVGTGAALVPIELCRRHPSVQVVATDHVRHMLELAQGNLEKSGLAGQVRLQRADPKRLPFPPRTFHSILSHGRVHQLSDPRSVLREMLRVLAPGGRLFVRDLMRPADDSQVAHLVDVHASTAHESLRTQFEASLRAALTLEEVRELAEGLGLYADTVQATSDRHWTMAVCLA